ncbi:Serine/threonine-protein kinase PK-1 [Andreprevotia sp. IGB-42]|uniref:serine/threonine protein kinase n=1 Tax=Andreprevotia sp. IGB-42 TaxID=2497473 RepID=UPI00157E34F8|nr:serine/threonine-protein kinase [Andreprevotia sp. IGB-42]KAF0811571.1 Serine/threonine-protein kinase PK-1 [Andreprevotia sp. IGB-42]
MTPDSVLDPATSQNTSAQPLPMGHRMGELELTGVLGIGGFGIVYRAFDHALQRVVAVKEYMPSMLAVRRGDLTVALRSERFSATFLAGQAGFINEARLLAQFDHPGLIKVLRFWEGHGTAYMATPFYEGQTLKQRLTGGRALAEAEILRLMAALLGALETLHRAQCFHRDIALDNVLIQPDGRPVLLDFGAARKLIGDLVDDSAVMLKSGYAPIEQYTDDPSFRQGPWTDLYALGAVIHVLVCGDLPPPAVVRSIQDNYVPLARRALSYSPRLLQAADQALQLRVVDRPQSVAEFAVLLGLQSAAPGHYSVPEYVPPAPPATQPVPAAVSQPAQAAVPAPARTLAEPAAAPVAQAAPADEHAPPVAAPVAAAAVQAAEPLPQVAAPPAGTEPAVLPPDLLGDDASISDLLNDDSSPLFAPTDEPAQTPLPQRAAEPEVQAGKASPPQAPEPAVATTAAPRKRFPWLITLGTTAVVAVVGLFLLLRGNTSPQLDVQAAASQPATPATEPVATIAPLAAAATEVPAAASEAATAPASSAPSVLPTQPDVEAQDWALARKRDSADGYQRYLQQYIGGSHEAEARKLLAAAVQRDADKALTTAAPVSAATPTVAPTTVGKILPVKLRISPWGEIYVDGTKRGVSPPLKTLSLPAGSYEIEVRNGNLSPYRTKLVVAPGNAGEIAHSFE